MYNIYSVLYKHIYICICKYVNIYILYRCLYSTKQMSERLSITHKTQ